MVVIIMNIITKDAKESQEETKNMEVPTEGMQHMEIEGTHEGTDTEGTQERIQEGTSNMEGLPEGRNNMSMESLSEVTIIVIMEGLCEGTMTVGITTAIPPLIRKRRVTIEYTIAPTKTQKLMVAMNVIYHYQLTKTRKGPTHRRIRCYAYP
jgi:hypothetical protein